jgi:hypothetical protein
VSLNNPALQAFLAVLGGFLAASGSFWVYLRHRYEHRDYIEKLIMGLAHDKILYLGILYLEKGFVTQDEYSDLMKYFWEPYRELGGDGSAERIMNMVQLLPLKPERREFPELRKMVDAAEKGAHDVLDQVEKGDDTFERPDPRNRT